MSLVIAGLQHAGHLGDPRANLRVLDAAAADAKTRGADILVTPEMFLSGYNLGDGLEAAVDEHPATALSLIAQRHGIALVVGLPERVSGGIANAAFFVGADGEIVARYRKTHLFGDLDRGMFVPGDELCPVIDYRGVRIGLMICYDVEFPETVRAASLAGADLVIVPTAQMEPYAWLAEMLIPVRAWENQVYVAYVNHSGSEGDLHYVGRSSVVAPSGEVLASLGGEENGLMLATVDPDVVRRARIENPYLTDLRHALYPRPSTSAAPRLETSEQP